MIVRDVMTTNVETIDSSAPLRSAAARMRELDIGVLPVATDAKLVGMVTDRDVVIRGVSEGLDPQETPVSRVMTPKVNVCVEDDELDAALDLMESTGTRRLVVLNKEHNGAVGIVSIGDIVVKGDRPKAVTHAMEQICQPAQPAHERKVS